MSANKTSEDCHCRGCESDLGACLEESLSDTSKSLDKFFCRQCLVNSKTLSFKILVINIVSKDCNGLSYNFLEQIFNCALHGISQPLVYPVRNNSSSSFQVNLCYQHQQ